MSVDRSTRTLLAAIFLLAALFVAMNRVVESAPLGEWWLPLLLFVVGVAFVIAPGFSLVRPADDESDETALAASGVHTYSVTSAKGSQVVVTEDTAVSVLPFLGATSEVAPVMPETPAPALEPEPEVEQAPVTPETPTPAVEDEPEVMSPETPAPEADEAEGIMTPQQPSQSFPVERAEDKGEPAPDLKYTARTEYADPDESTAKKDAPAEPPPAEGVTEPQRSEPEKEVVGDKMSAPQQPYETDQVGEITPERAERVMDDSTDNAHDTDVPARSESASARVTAQENGEGSVGSAGDLTKIKGIGRKSAQALKAAGIDSFHKLANSTDDAIRAALEAGGVRLVGDVATWSQQAAYAARGDWQGLDRFNAGNPSATGD